MVLGRQEPTVCLTETFEHLTRWDEPHVNNNLLDN